GANTFQLKDYGWLQAFYVLVEGTIRTISICGIQWSAIRPDPTADYEAVLHSEDVTTGANTFQLRCYGWLPASYGLVEGTIQTVSMSAFQPSVIDPDRTADSEAVLHGEDVTMGANTFRLRCYCWLLASYRLVEGTIRTISIS